MSYNLIQRSSVLVNIEDRLFSALQEETKSNTKIFVDDKRVSTKIREELDSYLLSIHSSTCPFAKQHNHAVGDVEQLPPAEVRFPKQKDENNQKK